MKKIPYILGGIALTLFPLKTLAQEQAKDSTMNRTVVVEQEYNPDIMDASKVNVLPKVTPPAVNKKEVEYDIALTPAREIPTPLMQVYTGKEVRTKALPGYVRLGYGNYGNLDARANYLFTPNDKDRFNLTFAMDGMNGNLELPDREADWSSYYYRTKASLDYVHTFHKADLNVAGNFGLSNFNFLPGQANHKQKFTSGDVHFGVKSTGDDLPLQFRAETNLLFYQRQHDPAHNDAQEGIVRTKADVTGAISDEQYIGLRLSMDNAFYKNSLFENQTSVALNPYYLFENEAWKVRLGAHVDLAFGFGKQFRAAPDLTAQYTFSDSYVLYARAKGGKMQNDFRRLERISPYGQLTEQPDATYEQLNAALGFQASPVSGLWFHLYGGYQNLKNDLMQVRGSDLSTAEESYGVLLFGCADTWNAYAGAEVRYDYKDLLSFTASGIYRNWNIADKATQQYLLCFKPQLEAEVRMDIQPSSASTLTLGYRNVTREKVEDLQANAVSNLYLEGSYEFLEGIGIYARINNLLNKAYQYDWGYPAEGINFVGGVSFRF